MTRNSPGSTNGHFRLVRVSSFGFVLELLWVLIAGPVWLGRWERTTSWVSLALAAALLVLWRTRPVQSFLAAQGRDPTYPARIFIAGAAIVLLVAMFFFGQLQYNPDALDSRRNATDLTFLGGALFISLVSLRANALAHRLGLRG